MRPCDPCHSIDLFEIYNVVKFRPSKSFGRRTNDRFPLPTSTSPRLIERKASISQTDVLGKKSSNVDPSSANKSINFMESGPLDPMDPQINWNLSWARRCAMFSNLCWFRNILQYVATNRFINIWRIYVFNAFLSVHCRNITKQEQATRFDEAKTSISQPIFSYETSSKFDPSSVNKSIIWIK